MVPMAVEQAPKAKPCRNRSANSMPKPTPARYSAENATSSAAPITSIRLRPTRSRKRPVTMRATNVPMMKMLAARPASAAGAS